MSIDVQQDEKKGETQFKKQEMKDEIKSMKKK